MKDLQRQNLTLLGVLGYLRLFCLFLTNCAIFLVFLAEWGIFIPMKATPQQIAKFQESVLTVLQENQNWNWAVLDTIGMLAVTHGLAGCENSLFNVDTVAGKPIVDFID